MKDYRKTFKACIVFGLVMVLFLIQQNRVSAAELYLEPATIKVGVGQVFSVRIVVDSWEENINAIESKMSFPKNLVALKDFSDAGSVISLWPQRPTIEAGSMYFAGLIPGGFVGKSKIMTLQFEVLKSGEGDVEFIDPSSVLLNDGKGSGTNLKLGKLHFEFLENASEAVLDEVGAIKERDGISPEPFMPTITRNSGAFNGMWFLAFSAQDKGSGIDRFELQENHYNTIDVSGWKVVESPYLLEDQKLDSYIFVKAIDKAGNERTVIINPLRSYPWYNIKNIAAVSLLMLLVGATILVKYIQRKNENLRDTK